MGSTVGYKDAAAGLEANPRFSAVITRAFPEMREMTFAVMKESEGHAHSQELLFNPRSRTDFVLCEDAALLHMAVLEDPLLTVFRPGLFIYWHEYYHSTGISSHKTAEELALKKMGNPVDAYAVHFAFDIWLGGDSPDYDIDEGIEELRFNLNDALLSRDLTFEEVRREGALSNVTVLNEQEWDEAKSRAYRYAHLLREAIPSAGLLRGR